MDLLASSNSTRDTVNCIDNNRFLLIVTGGGEGAFFFKDA